jgi:hypothetical protein
MKTTRPILLSISIAAIYGFAACSENKDHDHSGHDHDGHDDHKEGEAHPEGDDHGDHAGHDHDHIIAGPNGGRVLTGIEPHAEFFVTDERKVQIAFVDDDLKRVPASDQVVKVTAGDRKSPTRLEFQKSGDVLISDGALPDGNDFPISVQLKASADAKSVNERFNLDLNKCPTCKNKEYACVCDHGEDEE